MARIAGINIPLTKHVVIALTSIYGIGNTRAQQICEAAGVAGNTPVKDLAEPEVEKLRKAVAIFTVEGDSLVRPPKGFDENHPLIDDLKRKDFIASTTLTQKKITSDDFMDTFTANCAAGGPFMRFLCQAVGVPY